MYLRTKILLGLLSVVVCYGVADALLTNNDLILAIRVFGVLIYFVRAYVWWPEFMFVWRSSERKFQPADWYTLAVVLGACVGALECSYIVVWRLAGRPAWLANSDLTGLIALGNVLCAYMFVLPRERATDRLPRRNSVASAVGYGVALVVFVLLVATRPDLGPWLEHARPYIADVFGTG